MICFSEDRVVAKMRPRAPAPPPGLDAKVGDRRNIFNAAPMASVARIPQEIATVLRRLREKAAGKGQRAGDNNRRGKKFPATPESHTSR